MVFLDVKELSKEEKETLVAIDDVCGEVDFSEEGERNNNYKTEQIENEDKEINFANNKDGILHEVILEKIMHYQKN